MKLRREEGRKEKDETGRDNESFIYPFFIHIGRLFNNDNCELGDVKIASGGMTLKSNDEKGRIEFSNRRPLKKLNEDAIQLDNRENKDHTANLTLEYIVLSHYSPA